MSSIKHLHVPGSSARKDAALVRGIVAGDERAFRLFFNKYYPQVRGFVLSLLKNVDDAEDVAQLVFVNLWIKRELLADVDNIEAYIYRAGRNAVMNFIAKRKDETLPVPLDNSQDKAYTETPQDMLEMQDAKLLADMVVRHMPAQRRQVYEMSRVEGLPNDEIAKRMNLRKKTVENHLNMALRELRKVLKCLFLLMSWVWCQ